MKKSILILEDEKDQAINLEKFLRGALPDDYMVMQAHQEDDMLEAVENSYFSLAIVDLRMNDYKHDGIDLINMISKSNPLAKVIIQSSFTKEFYESNQDLLTSGLVVGVIEKEGFKASSQAIADKIIKYHDTLYDEDAGLKTLLLEKYSDAKNETNSQQKGKKFEVFIRSLFNTLHYSEIQSNVRDQSQSEIDLIVRNETDDVFLNKFGKYFLVECKNYSASNVDKNAFTIFHQKLENSSCMADLGFLVTTGGFTTALKDEAMRSSSSAKKVILLSNADILNLIHSDRRIETFKRIIDKQVKDN
ncbi:MAG: restriction endonuclease [Gammaproteobacteria bacterium]|nr:restriction endonuclease [Gammaproteobacteria bacterium]